MALFRFTVGDGALAYLLDKRSRVDLWQSWMAPCLYGAAAVPVLVLCALWGRFDVYWPIVGATLAFALPLARALADSGLMHSLLVGGGLDEVRQTRLSSAEIVDGLAAASLRRQLCTAPVPLAVAYVGLACQYGAGRALGLLGLWLLATLLATAMASYATQSSLARSHCSPGVPTSWSGLEVLLATWLVFWGLTLTDGSCWLRLIDGLMAVVLFLRQLRRSAIHDFTHIDLSTPAQTIASQGLQRRWQIRPWSDNPIVVRECAREAGSYRFGVWSYLWQRGAFFGMGACFFFLTVWAGNVEEALGCWSLLLLLALVVQVGRAGLRVSRAISDERDRGSFEAVMISRLRPEEFVDGWAQVGYRPRATELAAFLGASLLVLGSWMLPASGYCCGGMEVASVILVLALIYVAAAEFALPAAAYLSLAWGMRAAVRTDHRLDFLLMLGIGVWIVASVAKFVQACSPEEALLIVLAQPLFALLLRITGRSLALRTLGTA